MAKTEPKPEAALTGVYVVRGPEDGRFRGGLLFGPIPQEVNFDEIGAERATAIVMDPELSVIPKSIAVAARLVEPAKPAEPAAPEKPAA